MVITIFKTFPGHFFFLIIGTKNSEIEYYIVEGDYKQNFTIDSKTGVITPIQPLDFEQLLDPDSNSGIGNVQSLMLTIRARDHGIPSMSHTVPVVVYLHDVNDFAPIFEHRFYNRSIPENTPGGTLVLNVIIKKYSIIFFITL